MELIALTELDYYPLKMDLNDLRTKYKKEQYSLKTQVKFEDKIDEMIYACKNQLTVFQSCTLFLKHSFEGHAFLDYKIQSINSINQELIEISTVDDSIRFIYPELLSQIDTHFEGIFEVWKQNKLPEISSDDLYVLLYYIAINNLIKYPVVCLSEVVLKEIFKDINPIKNNLRRILTQSAMIEETTQKLVFLNSIVEKYAKTFDNQLRTKQLKSDILMQLLNKLQIAADPNITTTEELNSAYYEYIIQLKSNIHKVSGKNSTIKISNSEFAETTDLENKSNQNGIQISYRLIAKNCREIIVDKLLHEKLGPLLDYFFIATKAYNYSTENTVIKMIQQNILEQILTNVLIFRKKNRMSLYYSRKQVWSTKFRCNFYDTVQIERIQKELEDLYNSEKVINVFEFKLKQLADEEMIEFHKNYIKTEIEMMDFRIKEINDQITSIIKTKQNQETHL